MKVYVATSCRVVALLSLLVVGGNCMRIDAIDDRPHRHHKESQPPMTVIYHKKALLKPKIEGETEVSETPEMTNALVGHGHSHSTEVIHHAKVHHESKAKREIREIGEVTHFLTEVEKERKQKKMPPFDEWLPKCVHHVKALVADLDRSYTDAQLKYALQTDCHLDKEFTVYEDGFHNKTACEKFAELLVIAREADLKYGTDEGYKGFCTDYYLHKNGEIDEKYLKDGDEEDKGAKKKKASIEAASKEESSTPGYKVRGQAKPAPWGLIITVVVLQSLASAAIWFGCKLKK